MSDQTAVLQMIPARFERATPGFGGLPSSDSGSCAAERLLRLSPVFGLFQAARRAPSAVQCAATRFGLSPFRPRSAAIALLALAACEPQQIVSLAPIDVFTRAATACKAACAPAGIRSVRADGFNDRPICTCTDAPADAGCP